MISMSYNNNDNKSNFMAVGSGIAPVAPSPGSACSPTCSLAPPQLWYKPLRLCSPLHETLD